MHPDLIETIDTRCRNFEGLRVLVTSAGADAWDQPSGNPGWSCHDLLAHLATGDWVMQRVVRTALNGQDLSNVWGHDVNRGNAERITARRERTPDELLAELRWQETETLALWELLGDRRLDTPLPHWDGRWGTLREYLTGFTNHDRRHIEQLRSALQADRAF